MNASRSKPIAWIYARHHGETIPSSLIFVYEAVKKSLHPAFRNTIAPVKRATSKMAFTVPGFRAVKLIVIVAAAIAALIISIIINKTRGDDQLSFPWAVCAFSWGIFKALLNIWKEWFKVR